LGILDDDFGSTRLLLQEFTLFVNWSVLKIALIIELQSSSFKICLIGLPSA
jgi:hypothetical protein